MGGLNWIQLDANLINHPKTIHLSELLDDENAWGFLVKLWMWASQNEPSGAIQGQAAGRIVERVCGWTAKPGALVEALVESRWLDRSEAGDGTLRIHDWEDHQGAHIAKAERDRERMRKVRRTLRKRYANGSRTVDERSANVPGNSNRNKNSNKNTKEEDEKAEHPPPPTSIVHLPEEPSTPLDAWSAIEFWTWAQQLRFKAGLLPERKPNERSLGVWYSGALMTPGVTVQALKTGFHEFGQSKHWEKAEPPYPFVAFMKTWTTWVRVEVPLESAS